MGNCIGRDDAHDNISNGNMNNGGAHYPYSPPGTSSQSAVLTIAGGQPHFRGIKDNAMPSTASSHLINNNGEFCFAIICGLHINGYSKFIINSLKGLTHTSLPIICYPTFSSPYCYPVSIVEMRISGAVIPVWSHKTFITL
jgi:hypothetical protein